MGEPIPRHRTCCGQARIRANEPEQTWGGLKSLRLATFRRSEMWNAGNPYPALVFKETENARAAIED
jgi:hypothetical protein